MTTAQALRRPWKRLAKLSRDDGAKARFGHILHLLSGNAVAAALGLAAVALTARGLGPRDYGILALTFAYVQAVERLVSFQAWQPLIRYGAGLMSPGDERDLGQLLKFGLLLDILGAFSAWLVAIGGVFVASWWLGWTERTVVAVLLFSTVLPFGLNGMPTAVLRLTGRFKLAAYGQVASALVRVALCAAALGLGAGLLGFAVVWMAVQIGGAIVLLITAGGELGRRGLLGFWRIPLSGVRARFPGIWSFALLANLSLTIRSSAQQFDTLIVGALAGPAAAGFYHIAKRIGRMAQQVAQQVQAVVYPEVSRFVADGALDKLRRVVTQVEVALLAFGVLAFLVMLVVAEPLLKLLAGPAFGAAAPLVVVQMIAVTLAISGSAARSALLALGKQKQVLAVVLVGTAAFHAVALLLVPRIGAMGANIAHIVLGAIWVGGLTYVLRRTLREQRSET